MACGAWHVGHGMWGMACGAWHVGHGMWGMACPCRPKLSTENGIAASQNKHRCITPAASCVPGSQNSMLVQVWWCKYGGWQGSAPCRAARPCRCGARGLHHGPHEHPPLSTTIHEPLPLTSLIYNAPWFLILHVSCPLLTTLHAGSMVPEFPILHGTKPKYAHNL